jgi:riboflavin kinase/FMN adenylyltransferase
MKIIYGVRKIKRYPRPVVALGVFDGVHRGHRLVLSQAVKKARDIQGTSIAVTFSPHPQNQRSIYSLAHRLRILAELGCDVCVVINFTRAFAKSSADDFIKNILAEKLGSLHIYIGKNFRFGKGASGNSRLLKRYAPAYGYRVKALAVKKIHGRNISSTLIRSLIAAGRLTSAQQLLSRRVSVFGTVVKGISLATRIGFSTANIDPHHEVVPPPGVYLVDVVLGSKKLRGICNIGFRPAFVRQRSAETDPRIEVHIFNFRGDIYGKDMEVQFIKFMRPEKKFTSLRHLAAQIKKDVQTAKKYFSRH